MKDIAGKNKRLQIIGAGFGRSGTMSLQKALEILGYKPCYHMQVALFRYHHLKFWIRAKNGEAVDYVRFFRKYRATVDWPASDFYKELMDIFPDAKVLLNVRDPEEWYDSMKATIWAIQPIFRRSFPRAYIKIHDDILWNSRFQGEFENRAKAVSIYKAYVEEVKKTVPPNRLLVYNVNEGWKPLCEFLGVPPPDNTPFPFLNDKKKFRRLLITFRVLEWALPILLAVLIIILMILWLSFTAPA